VKIDFHELQRSILVKTGSAGFGQQWATVNVFSFKKEIVTIVADTNLEIHVGVS
jgi:hypothetical protein